MFLTDTHIIEVFNRHTHTHRVSDEGMGRAVKNSLEIVIKMALPGTLNFLNTILANTGNIAQFAPEANRPGQKHTALV